MSWFDDFLNEQKVVIPAAAKMVGNFFGQAGENAANSVLDAPYNVASFLHDAPYNVARTIRGQGSGQPQSQGQKNPDWRWPAGELALDNGTGGMDPYAQETDPLDELRRLLDEKYSGSPVDTSFMESALSSRLAPISTARDQANENFKTSDANLQAMHDAFKNQIFAQAPQIQQQNQQYQKDLTGVFDKTLEENKQRAAAAKAADAEMYQRLGIAPAANQPDLVGQAIEQGNQRTTGSRDARLAEAATLGQGNLSRNTAAAQAVGNDALARRSDLSRRLQDILGQLGSKEADIQSNFQQQKSQAAQEQEARNYQRFLADRNFNMQRYNNERSYRQKAQQAGGNTVDGLNSSTDPAVVNAVSDALSNEPNIDMRFPNQVLQAVKRRRGRDLSQDEANAVFNYITQYNKLGTNKASAFQY